MKFSMEVRMDNDAFADGRNGQELARILIRLADLYNGLIMDDESSGSLFDINGNKVGSYTTEED